MGGGAGQGLARGWAIGGVSDRTREAATAAADAAGVPVGAWIEQALGEVLEARAGPVSLEQAGEKYSTLSG